MPQVEPPGHVRAELTHVSWVGALHQPNAGAALSSFSDAVVEQGGKLRILKSQAIPK